MNGSIYYGMKCTILRRTDFVLL